MSAPLGDFRLIALNKKCAPISGTRRALTARCNVPLLRRMSILIVSLVLVPVMTCPAVGQSDTVELQLKLEQAEPLYYRLSTQVSKELPNARETTTAEGRLALRVLDVEPDGTMAVESVIEDLLVTTNGQVACEGATTPEVAKIRPDGTIVVVKGSEQFGMPLSFAKEFPRRPLSVGDSWSTAFQTVHLSATADVNVTFTLDGVDRTDAGRVAHVRAQVKGTVTRFNLLPQEALPYQAQVPAKGTVEGSGEVIWLVEQGRLLQSNLKTVVDLDFVASGSGQTYRGHVMSQATVRLEALPRDKIVGAGVSPDLLIVPGKAIGPFALDHGMNDLVDKLGQPGSGASAPNETMWGADRGFLSAEASWPNGLVGYVDWDNRSMLLGLGVADCRFRTDKGLGFGSSERAVLFAQGMSPTRLNMKSRFGLPGSVQVLIYNDQGIAFAITVEDTHARVKGSHAPAGTVAWIVVFPPGNAGKIFPLP